MFGGFGLGDIEADCLQENTHLQYFSKSALEQELRTSAPLQTQTSRKELMICSTTSEGYQHLPKVDKVGQCLYECDKD